ncbi:UNVERIFIED_CONTAM: Heavy metal-associated isoprenylated plant protein 3 [Sesamum latifolium]|uniref:Heavy metal-associated isoprenylated plant protein 3 n=1 Tax=Sesamum latifolium TaxID=2727402 RepID=A0AAW2Y575_9LAMI
MGEKNKKNSEGEQKDGENKKKENGGGKNNVTVVLKADLHCEGCASKVIKCIRSFDGVDTVTMGDGQTIMVVGEVDPAKLREKVEQKTHKKVELISPQPKKDGDKKENGKGKENSGGDNAKQEKKKESKDKNSNDKSDEKKSKEKEVHSNRFNFPPPRLCSRSGAKNFSAVPYCAPPPVVTAVLKVNLHCDGCIQKIYKTVTKTKGYQDIKIDTQNDLVMVTGSMDMNALAELLQKQLKKDVEIVPPKKDGEKKEKGGGDKGKSGGDGGEAGGDGGDEKMEGNKMQSQPVGYPYPFMYGPSIVGDQFHYNPYAAGSYQYHAPQIFSDENPNSCSVM